MGDDAIVLGECSEVLIPEVIVLNPAIHENDGIALPRFDEVQALIADSDLLDGVSDNAR